MRHTVRGHDQNKKLVKKLKQGISTAPWDAPNLHPNFKAFYHLEKALIDSQAVFICVPTPERGGWLLDQEIETVLETLKSLGWDGLTVIVSTLDPRGISSIFEHQNLVYNPPLVRLGHVIHDLLFPSMLLIGGYNPLNMDKVQALWNWSPDSTVLVFRADPLTIATAKLAINATLSSKIAWANDIIFRAKEVGADAAKVLQIVTTDPRIGASYMKSGAPPAGPCIPRDLYVWHSLHAQMDLVYAVSQSHAGAKTRLLDRVVSEIKAVGSKPKVAILGITYNPGTTDYTGSIGLGVYHRGLAKGWDMVVCDPSHELIATQLPYLSFVSVEAALAYAQVIVVATEWPEFQDLDSGDKLVIWIKGLVY